MHRARLTAAPFAVVVALSSLVIAMGCGGEDDPVAVAQDDLTPSVEVDPWSGVWAIVSVGGANPSVTEHGEIAAIDSFHDCSPNPVDLFVFLRRRRCPRLVVPRYILRTSSLLSISAREPCANTRP